MTLLAQDAQARQPVNTPASDARAYWMAEWLRLREEHWGPMEDAAEVRRARAEGAGFSQRIVLRARLLCSRTGLAATLDNWVQGARLALLLLAGLAIVAGAGAAMGALGNGLAPVNIALALVAILGLHCLTYLLWILSFAVHNDMGMARLGQLWLWLTRKLARGPDSALLPTALTSLLGRNGSLRWGLGAISHGLWTLAFISLLVVMLAALSTRRYDFNWQTTLLTPDTFVHLTAALGWLPSALGFSIPTDAMVRASNGLHALPDTARSLWSSWLVGCVVVYGLLPRVLGLVLCFFLARRRLARLSLDENLPGFADLRQRLMPTSETTGIDAPPSADATPAMPPRAGHTHATGLPAVAGIELPADWPWPPKPDVTDLGVIDSRIQRQKTLDLIQRQPPSRLLLFCDARQTPDRGAIALIAELRALAADARVTLAGPADDRIAASDATATPSTPDTPRRQAWRTRLLAAGLPPEHVYDRTEPALNWLAPPSGADHG